MIMVLFSLTENNAAISQVVLGWAQEKRYFQIFKYSIQIGPYFNKPQGEIIVQ